MTQQKIERSGFESILRKIGSWLVEIGTPLKESVTKGVFIVFTDFNAETTQVYTHGKNKVLWLLEAIKTWDEDLC